MSKGTGNSSLFRNLIIMLGIACMVAAGYSGLQVNSKARDDSANIQNIANLRVKALRITQLARDATAGDELGFESLSTLNTQMNSGWTSLKNTLSKQSEISLAQINKVSASWEKVSANMESLADNREAVLFVSTVAHELNAKLPLLQDNSEQVVDALVARSAQAGQITIAQEQLWLIERIGRNIDKMIAGSEDANVAADQFKNDSNVFRDTLDAMKNGNFILGISKVTDPDAIASINEIEQSFNIVSSEIERIHESADELSTAQASAAALVSSAPALLTSLDQLEDLVRDLPLSDHRLFNNTTTLMAVSGFLAALILLGLIIYTTTRRNLIEAEKVKDKNQQAILTLLNDISDLADGDLTAEATVTEDFTGTIADSINFAIAELRSLVQNVASTSEKVASSTDNTRSISLQLAESAENQAQEIAGASAAINEMAITIDQVSSNSAESAAVAERSVSIAKKGASVVRDTIEGMDTIREQIQDTSKRIKRLGESSQEIGDIVSLINEIADQTNILALNAAIQAAMAGEAGRGFAVVADEVQRLAERSTTATKQIAGLVKTIQSDTHEAVASMEQTTAEVVKGAELANSAGIALEEIETVSTNLAELIQDISEAAKHQATTSSHISNTMNVIQEITSQTLSGTNDTAQSIGDLADMAVEMRESVSGFILPSPEDLMDQTGDDPLDDNAEPMDASEYQDFIEDEPTEDAMQSLDSEQMGDEDSEIESELELHQESDQDEFLIQDANSLIVQDADTGEDDSEKQDEEEHDPFHLDEFEAEIEALLTDTDKPR
ncbi:methyl-accepting chemotaxis protein [SAR92 clade bacterium H231]|nr:methyl-accepting chemotaxis protein [SAR92 clade bacterium H231]